MVSIPSVAVLRVRRTPQEVQVLRIWRAFRLMRHLLHQLFRSRVQGTFMAVALVAVLMVIFSAIAILQVETSLDHDIKTAKDALWWVYSTITAVGYGDKCPITGAGRLVAVVLMTVGVGLFGMFTESVASWFVAGQEGASANLDEPAPPDE